MARKDLLKSVMSAPTEAPARDDRADYALRGASKSMKVSIDNLAENAKKMMDGETIVEIEPGLIDVSFVSDRLSGDDEAFEELKRSIESGNQESPVLLRPHPKSEGRYMIVFGHRRVRVAKALDRNVKAVIKSMDDVSHILAQGQENTARADLSFIEKALFAKKLLDMGQGRDVIQSALTVDATLLSRMLAVSQKIPADIIEAIGPAKSVGRDRWEEFKRLAVLPANRKAAGEKISSPEFSKMESDVRFEFLLSQLSKKRAAAKKPSSNSKKKNWAPDGGQIKGVIATTPKGFNLSLSAADAIGFGDYLTNNLDRLYQSFSETKREK